MTWTIALAVVVGLVVGAAAWLWRERRRALVERDTARTVSELGYDPVLVADIVQGRILSANAAAATLLGYEPAELLRRTLPELHPPELLGRSSELIADVWEKKGLVYSDLPFVRKDGERVDVEVSASVIQYATQPALLVYARDIRERRRLEEQVRQLALFPETNPMPVLRVSSEGRVSWSNPSTRRFLETIGHADAPLEALLPPGYVDRFEGALRESRVVVQEPYEALGRSLTATYRPISDRGDLFVMVVDVTDQVQAQQRALAHARELEAKNREIRDAQSQLVQSEKMAALGNLVAGVAHELNTPIGAIHSNADVARRALEVVRQALAQEPAASAVQGQARLERALSILEETTSVTANASERVAGIVRSLRNFARLDEAERKRVDLHEGIDSTLMLLRHELKQRIQVVKQYGQIPEIECFPNQLNQVFMNLLVNAIHAIEGEGTITIETRVDGDQVVVEFTDSGKGIAPDHLPRVFDPGFTTKGVGVGTGLGLSITFRIVQDHAGTIAARSEPGHGATFTLRLPIR